MVGRISKWLDRQNVVVQLVIIFLFVVFIRTYFIGLYLVPSGSMETTMLVGERFFAEKLTPYFVPFKRGEIIAFNSPKFKYSNNAFIAFWQRNFYGPENWTKRIIGIPGDHVQGVIEDGKPVVYLNNRKLDEPYLNKYPLIPLWDRKYGCTGRITLKSYDPKAELGTQPFYNIDPVDLISDPSKGQMLWPQTPDFDGKDVFDITLGEDEYWVMGDNRRGSDDCRSWGHPLKEREIHGRILFCIWSADTNGGWLLWDMISNPLGYWKDVRWSRCMRSIR